MPYDLRTGAYFLVGLWLSLWTIGPLTAPYAYAADPELARMEAELHRSVNAFRQEQRLIKLERRRDVDAVARAHSEDMVQRRFFSHQNPEGRNWVGRLQQAGVSGFALAGENVGQTNRANPNREIVEGWKTSPDHRENLTARPYNTTGIGIARAPDGSLFYTQLYLTFPR